MGWVEKLFLTQSPQTEPNKLAPILSLRDLVFAGLGAMIGSGIFVLIGVVSATNGPATVICVALAGVVATLAALCYAEFSSMHPVSGSSYSYAYLTLGELPAWAVGWSLLLEYTVGTAAIARGWAGYTVHLLENFSEGWREQFLEYPLEGTPFSFSFVAPAVVLVLTGLAVLGVSESTNVAMILCVIKVGVLTLVSVAGVSYGTTDNWTDQAFAPAGVQGIMSGASILVYAYAGFDMLTTLSGESVRPERDMPLAIIISCGVSTALYLATACALTFVSTREEIDTNSPLSEPFAKLGHAWVAVMVSIGAFAGITSALIVSLLGMARIWYTAAADGLLPEFLAVVHPTWKTPKNAQIFSGLLAAGFATVLDLPSLSSLMASGTLFAFVLVSSTLILLKYKFEYRAKWCVAGVWAGTIILGVGLLLEVSVLVPVGIVLLVAAVGVLTITMSTKPTGAGFVIPLGPLVPLASTSISLGGFLALDRAVWIRFWVWMVLGLAVYAFYGLHHSKVQLANSGEDERQRLVVASEE